MIRPSFRRYKKPVGYLRIVQHDRPSLLELHRELEKEVLIKDVARKFGILVATAAVLGLTWAAVEAVAWMVRFVR